MFRRRRSDADFQAEIEAHIELEAARLIEQGMPEEAARAAARRTFGNRTSAQERFHERARWLWLDSLSQDVHLTVRLLAKTPGWTAVAALTAALGIGASVAMFSVVYAVLLRPLPYPDADRIYWISEDNGQRVFDTVGRSRYTQLVENAREFTDVAIWDLLNLVWAPGGNPEPVDAGIVSASFFRVFQVQPLHGRWFLPEEDAAQEVAILSHVFWQQAFAADPSVIGRTVRFTRGPLNFVVTIVGVMPAEFRTPNVDALDVDLWLPLGRYGAVVVARARGETTPQRLRADLDRLSALASEARRAVGVAPAIRVLATRLDEHLAARPRTAVLVFGGAVALMLLIVCFNLANLMLTRATARQREIAVRLALGSPRRRIVHQLLTESLLVSMAGGCLGIALARAAITALNASRQAAMLGLPEVSIDAWVAAFAVSLTVLTGATFGLAPALGALGFSVRDALQRESRSASSTRGLRRTRRALAVVQLGFSLTLLIGAGLLAKSYLQIWHTDPGFQPENLVTIEASVPNAAPVAAELRELPGVQEVAHSTAVPGTGMIGGVDFTFDDRPGERQHSQIIGVSPGFFSTMAVPLRAGRVFTGREAGLVPEPVLVNESFARQFFPGSDAIGRRMRSLPFPRQQPDDWVIVGVIADIRQHQLEQETPLMIYAPYAGPPRGWIVRTAADPGPLIPAIQRILLSYMPGQPPPPVLRVRDRFYESLAPRRFNAVLIGAFALMAVVLAAIGVYGVMSYLVALRAKELGIRLALGARPAALLAMIVKEGAVLGILGAGLGLTGAAALTRYLSSLLLNVSPRDLSTFGLLAAVLLVVAVAACYVPSRRAASSDPVAVLRHE